jgi:hypothetical protein
MKNGFVKFIFCALITGFLSLDLNAQVLEDYQTDWKEGNETSWFSANDRIEVQLDLESFPMSFFHFEIPKSSVVFFDKKLWFFSEKDTVFHHKVEDLQIQFKSKTVNLTVYNEGIEIGDAQIKKLLTPLEKKVERVEESFSNEGLLIIERDFGQQEIKGFFILVVLLLLTGVALYKFVNPFLFGFMIRPVSLVKAEDFSESGSLQKFFSFDVLSYLILVNLGISLFGVFGLVFLRQDWLDTRVIIGFESLFWLWLALGSFLLIFSIFKFIGIRLIAYLFALERLEFSHYFYLLRITAIVLTFFLVISVYLIINNYSFLGSFLSFSFSVFFWIYLAGIAALFLIMMNRLSFKKYHLFAYLCIAELVPFLVLSKWIMDLGQ